MMENRTLTALTILGSLAIAAPSRAATTVQTSGLVQWTDSVQSEYYGDSKIVTMPTQALNTDSGNTTFTSGVASIVAGDSVYRNGQYTPSTVQYGQQGHFLQDFLPGQANSVNKIAFSFSTPQSFFGALVANQGSADIATFSSGGTVVGTIALSNLAANGPGYAAAGVNVKTYYLNAAMAYGQTFDNVTFTNGNTYVADIRYSTTNIDLTTLTSSGSASAKKAPVVAAAGGADVPEPAALSLLIGAAAMGATALRIRPRA